MLLQGAVCLAVSLPFPGAIALGDLKSQEELA